MVSSLKQVRHLYVANALVEENKKILNKGDIKIGTTKNTFQKEIYFQVKGYDTVLKSDYIPVNSIVYAKAIRAKDMEVHMKKVTVTLKENVNGGAPIVGQDYILRINLRQFYGMSDQDQYFKDAAVHVNKGMDATAFYKAMEEALNLCFAREVGANKESNPYFTFSSSAAGLVIEEKVQPWTLGTEALERVYFDVVPTTVYDGVDDLIWGKIDPSVSENKVGNGKNIADLEYFLLGERGDQYRKIGFPNDIETKGLVDPDKNYDVFEIHYSFSDTGVNSYKTEKDLTLVVPASVTEDNQEDYTLINSIIGAFNKATGLTVETLAKKEAVTDHTEEEEV